MFVLRILSIQRADNFPKHMKIIGGKKEAKDTGLNLNVSLLHNRGTLSENHWKGAWAAITHPLGIKSMADVGENQRPLDY